MSNNKEYIYEFIERDETNPLNDKLVKKNVDVEFTMAQLDQYTHEALRQLDQMRGQLNLEAAKQSNVVENHEDAISLVKDLDPVKQNAILIWLKAKEMIDALAPRRDKLEADLKEHEAEIEVIKKQTGWTAPVKAEDNEEDNNQEDADETATESK